ncbi:cob(I)yrinic acid a,c-diamide adenosyltransferase [Kurthia senegalensis]|uniref:cob(I)yrinic acid a,c-diamide adenosyltransferase n=1 Tax=Kurthia senegalensis TaxID=1033740 RepID=UPI0002882A73|nr:cob(I)yrinic acid a,c-diamide adenosyltransferase [Kurthia senegalensis]
MNIYTKTGDKGQTSIIGGRVDKDDARVEAYGTIDELNAIIGKALTELEEATFGDICADLEKIQNELFDGGGDLANVMKERHYKLADEPIAEMEERIDVLMTEAPELQKFVLPGGSPAAATLHIARTVARRAERQTVTLMKQAQEGDVSPVVQRYLNRLSDYLFAASLVVNARLNINNNEYVRSANVFTTSKKKS